MSFAYKLLKKIMRKIYLFIVTFLSFFCASLNAQEKISSLIEFVVNTTNIVDNGQNYKYYNIILPEVKEKANNIDYVYIIGSASPEGKSENNYSLAENRANKIFLELTDFIPENKIIINNNHELFVRKTNVESYNYPKQRAVYVEFAFKKNDDEKNEVKVDTVFVNNIVEKVDTIFVHNEKKKPLSFHVSFYTDLVQDGYLIPNLGVEFSLNNFSLFTDAYYSSWNQRNVFDLNAGIRYYFGKKLNGFYIETFFKKTDNEVAYKQIALKDGLGAGIGIGVRMNVNKTIGFGLFTRGGWLNHSRENYIEQTKISVEGSSLEIVTPSVVSTSKNYFGLFNFGCNMIIRF